MSGPTSNASTPICFTCGVEREEGDGLRGFSRPDRRHERPHGDVACVWTPHAAFAVCAGPGPGPEVIWAALDCPTFPPGWSKEGRHGALARHHDLRGVAPARRGEPCIVTAWPLAREVAARGTPRASPCSPPGGASQLARAHQVWITMSVAAAAETRPSPPTRLAPARPSGSKFAADPVAPDWGRSIGRTSCARLRSRTTGSSRAADSRTSSSNISTAAPMPRRRSRATSPTWRPSPCASG